ncbi:MAG: thiamine-binding protein [Cyclobacteriaceae bacterium]
MNQQINASIQIVPVSKRTADHSYKLIDEAIAVIADSGLEFRVTPMETVVQGPYDEVMQLFKKAQEKCFAAGADELVVQIRLHLDRRKDIDFRDKTGKYED